MDPEEAGFWAAINERPADLLPLGLLCDWLADRGDEREPPLRWCYDNRRVPLDYTPRYASLHWGWTYALERESLRMHWWLPKETFDKFVGPGSGSGYCLWSAPGDSWGRNYKLWRGSAERAYRAVVQVWLGRPLAELLPKRAPRSRNRRLGLVIDRAAFHS
jgi:hypothetical protein